MLTYILFKSVSTFGFCTKGLTVMFLNISSVIRSENLRDILLFEADFKFSNELYFVRRLMKREEISGYLPRE